MPTVTRDRSAPRHRRSANTRSSRPCPSPRVQRRSDPLRCLCMAGRVRRRQHDSPAERGRWRHCDECRSHAAADGEGECCTSEVHRRDGVGSGECCSQLGLQCDACRRDGCGRRSDRSEVGHECFRPKPRAVCDGRARRRAQRLKRVLEAGLVEWHQTSGVGTPGVAGLEGPTAVG